MYNQKILYGILHIVKAFVNNTDQHSISKCVCVCVCLCVCMRMCVCMRVCMCVCSLITHYFGRCSEALSFQAL